MPGWPRLVTVVCFQLLCQAFVYRSVLWPVGLVSNAKICGNRSSHRAEVTGEIRTTLVNIIPNTYRSLFRNEASLNIISLMLKECRLASPLWSKLYEKQGAIVTFHSTRTDLAAYSCFLLGSLCYLPIHRYTLYTQLTGDPGVGDLFTPTNNPGQFYSLSIYHDIA